MITKESVAGAVTASLAILIIFAVIESSMGPVKHGHSGRR